jgi:hypothetical protein
MSATGESIFVRFEVFMAVTMKHGVFWDVMPCGSCKNRRFGVTWVLTRATWRNIPEDIILQSLSLITHSGKDSLEYKFQKSTDTLMVQ